MPELKPAGQPLPPMTHDQLMNVLMVAPWTSAWDGSAGSCRIHEEKLVLAYVDGQADEKVMQLVQLRLNTEMKVPSDQIRFESVPKKMKIQ